MNQGKLIICGLPIGNLADISQRVLDTLKSVDLIAAEDTRDLALLLSQLKIKKELVSYHEHSDDKKLSRIIELIQNGKNVALVSDAGMPTISDPGYQLVKKAHEEGISVDVVPGPTALATALALSGMPSDRFTFEGFLNRNANKRKEQLENLKDESRTMIFYEAPHRIIETLKSMSEILGDRECFVVRELTKRHQEYYRGNLQKIMAEVKPKGEFVIVVAGTKEKKTERGYQALVNILEKKGLSQKDIIEIVAEEYQISKNILKKELFNQAQD